jgi:hypothetical protein
MAGSVIRACPRHAVVMGIAAAGSHPRPRSIPPTVGLRRFAAARLVLQIESRSRQAEPNTHQTSRTLPDGARCLGPVVRNGPHVTSVWRVADTGPDVPAEQTASPTCRLPPHRDVLDLLDSAVQTTALTPFDGELGRQAVPFYAVHVDNVGHASSLFEMTTRSVDKALTSGLRAVRQAHCGLAFPLLRSGVGGGTQTFPTRGYCAVRPCWWLNALLAVTVRAARQGIRRRTGTVTCNMLA